jgi:hypothetical protein
MQDLTFLEYSYPTSANAEKWGHSSTGCYHFKFKRGEVATASETAAIQQAIELGVELYRFDVNGNHKLLTKSEA